MLQRNINIFIIEVVVNHFNLRRKQMEFQKIDFSKLFDITVAIDNMEKGITTMITYLPEQVRKSAHTVNDAQFSLIRTTYKGFKEYAETVEAVAKEAQKEITKNIEKATKVAA